MNLVKLSKLYGNVQWAGRKRIMGMPITLTKYVLTDTKLITVRGLFSLKEDEVELYRVIDKTMNIPLGQRVFGCGTITLTCADSDTPVKDLKSIKKPREVKALIDRYVEEQRKEYRVRGRDMIGAAGVTSEGIIDDIADINY